MKAVEITATVEPDGKLTATLPVRLTPGPYRVLIKVEETQSRPSQESVASKPPLENPYGLWAGLSIDVTREDIAEARKEMWGRFTHEEA